VAEKKDRLLFLQQKKNKKRGQAAFFPKELGTAYCLKKKTGYFFLGYRGNRKGGQATFFA